MCVCVCVYVCEREILYGARNSCLIDVTVDCFCTRSPLSYGLQQVALLRELKVLADGLVN